MTHQVDVGGCGEGKVLEEFGFGSGAVEEQNLQCAEADNSLGRLPIHIWTGVDQRKFFQSRSVLEEPKEIRHK